MPRPRERYQMQSFRTPASTTTANVSTTTLRHISTTPNVTRPRPVSIAPNTTRTDA